MAMKTPFILIPGAGGAAWYWHRLVPLLEAAGHEAIAVELPGDDPDAGLPAYEEKVIAKIGSRKDVALVGMSLGGFTAALVAPKISLRTLVFLNAMIPVPGETPGAWWGNTKSTAARKQAAQEGGYGEKFELQTYFLHDVPEEVLAGGADSARPEAEISFMDPATFQAWPDVPIHVVASTEDRFFPVSFQERVARERLNVGIDRIRGGHLVALSHPQELADLLLSYVR